MVHRRPHDEQEVGRISGLVHLDLTTARSNEQRETAYLLTQLRRGSLARIHVGDRLAFEAAPDVLQFIAEAVANGVDVNFEGTHRAIAAWMYEAYHEARRVVQTRRPRLQVVEA